MTYCFMMECYCKCDWDCKQCILADDQCWSHPDPDQVDAAQADAAQTDAAQTDELPVLII